jgi:hypothetical protein
MVVGKPIVATHNNFQRMDFHSAGRKQRQVDAWWIRGKTQMIGDKELPWTLEASFKSR